MRKTFEEVRPALLREGREVRADICPGIRYYGKAIGPVGIALYSIICTHTRDLKEAWPGLDALAEESGTTKPTVVVYLKKLIRYQIIKVEATSRDDGGDAANIYTLTPLSDWLSPSTVFCDEGVKQFNTGGKIAKRGVLSNLTRGVKQLNRGVLSSLTQSPSSLSPSIEVPQTEGDLLSDGQMPADEALLASPLDERDWELPPLPLPEETQAEHGSLTEMESPPVAPPPQTTSRGRGRPANAPTVGPAFAEDSAAVRLALHLRYCLHLRDPRMIVPPEKWDSKQIQVWAAEMDRMLRIDHRTDDEAAVIITKAVSDKFWGKNVHSPGKLREKYDRLRQEFDIGMPDVTTNSQGDFNHAKTTRSQQSPRRSSIGQAPKGDYAPHVNPIVPSYD